jgi:hypothetical protein
LSSVEEGSVVMGKLTSREAARFAAFRARAMGRRYQAERGRRLEKLAMEVLSALGERDATIGATKQRAAPQALIADDGLTVSA